MTNPLDPFAGISPVPLSSSGTHRRDALRRQLTGMLKRRRWQRRAVRVAVLAACLVLSVWWFYTPPPPVNAPSQLVVVDDRAVHSLARWTMPERPLPSDLFLDDEQLQDWLRRANMAEGFIKVADRFVLLAQVD